MENHQNSTYSNQVRNYPAPRDDRKAVRLEAQA